MDDWLSWSGWTGISGVAQLFSLVAIVFAVYEYIVRRRRISVAFLSHSWGVVQDAGASRTYYVVDIVNAGGQLAILSNFEVVNGSIVPNPDFPVGYTLSGGGKSTIWIDAPDPMRVWFRWTWVTPEDKRFEYCAWRPMVNGDQSEVARKWDAANLRNTGGRFPRSIYFDRRPKPVDPDNAAFGRIRVTRNLKRFSARVRRLRSPISDPVYEWKFGLMDPRKP